MLSSPASLPAASGADGADPLTVCVNRQLQAPARPGFLLLLKHQPGLFICCCPPVVPRSRPGRARLRCRFSLTIMKARKDTCKVDLTGLLGAGVLEALWRIKTRCLLLLLISNVASPLRRTMGHQTDIMSCFRKALDTFPHEVEEPFSCHSPRRRSFEWFPSTSVRHRLALAAFPPTASIAFEQKSLGGGHFFLSSLEGIIYR